MIIIGCDFHTRFQQVAMLDPTTGEMIERRLEHENGEAEKFYETLPGPARVGMEATINAQWFERMLRRYHHELWIGDAARIRAASAKAEDRLTGCPTYPGFAARKSISAHLDSILGRAGRPADVATST